MKMWRSFGSAAPADTSWRATPSPQSTTYDTSLTRITCADAELTFRGRGRSTRSEEHTSELQSRPHLVCRLLLEKKKKTQTSTSVESASTHRTYPPAASV